MRIVHGLLHLQNFTCVGSIEQCRGLQKALVGGARLVMLTDTCTQATYLSLEADWQNESRQRIRGAKRTTFWKELWMIAVLFIIAISSTSVRSACLPAFVKYAFGST